MKICLVNQTIVILFAIAVADVCALQNYAEHLRKVVEEHAIPDSVNSL